MNTLTHLEILVEHHPSTNPTLQLNVYQTTDWPQDFYTHAIKFGIPQLTLLTPDRYAEVLYRDEEAVEYHLWVRATGLEAPKFASDRLKQIGWSECPMRGWLVLRDGIPVCMKQ